ncbi:MAG: prepilin peptidase [Paracoccaceae bacterium]
MIMDPAILPIAAAALIPLLAYTMWTDLKHMRIPNVVCLLIFLVFIPTGLAGLPIETFGWRLAHAAIAFVVGYAFFTVTDGAIGAGDIKLAVALTPYVSAAGLPALAELYIIASVLTLVVFVGLRAGLRGRTRLAAIEAEAGSILKAPFPFAWILASSFIAFLCFSIAVSL